MRVNTATSIAYGLGLLLGVVASTIARGEEPAASPDFFEAKIRPVLVQHCVECHGADKASHDLRLDGRQAMLAGGESGPALLPGRPEESLLLIALGQQTELKMPPDAPLPAEVVRDFRRWIEAGAPWPDALSQPLAAQRHWSWVPPGPIALPPASGDSAHPIDRFVAAQWAQRGLKPVALADRATLARRVYFDLLGLPPTPDELDAFVNDPATDAYPRLLEQLLASPRYGERWGRHWMDVVRYADTAGDNADYPVPELHRYRDYIIASFNADKPYDLFLQEQLAGDLLAASGPRDLYAERVTATSFLALSRRYGTMPGELWHLTLEDTIDTIGQAMLGLTLRCARCHDHKFDPISTADYYRLYGIFASTAFPFAGSEELVSKKLPRAGFAPLVPAAEAEPALLAYREAIAALSAQAAHIENEGPTIQQQRLLQQQSEALQQRIATADAASSAQLAQERDQLNKEIEALTKQHKKEVESARTKVVKLQRPGLPVGLAAAYAVHEGTPTDVAIQQRGEPGQPGPVVPRGAIAGLAGGAELAIPPGQSGRLQLARWLTAPDHPLTARVMVNRIWQHHFGQGLVATPSNFGRRGSLPSHPELLDWLANQFVQDGWSIKQMHRRIMTSRAYQLSSAASEQNQAIDPGNALLWRANRRRLDAEALRDAMLAVSGNLTLDHAGPQPFPATDDWKWTQHSPFKDIYTSRQRSVYLMTQRIQRHPFLALFDGADTNYTTAARTSATVPLQALYLMNNPFVVEQASGFAQRLCRAAPDARIQLGYRWAWGRSATAEEQNRARHYVATATEELRRAGLSDEASETQAWTSLAKLLLTANEFLYVD